MRQSLIEINNQQFATLLQQLDKTDWIGISSQLLIAVIAAGSAYFFQKLFKKQDTIAYQRDGVLKFNEAVSFFGIFTENLVMNLEQVVFPTFITERDYYMNLENIFQNKSSPPILRTTFSSILPIEPLQVDLLTSKIPAIGSQPEIIMAFYRLRTTLTQYVTICQERDYLIKKLLSNDTEPTQNEVISLRFGEILDRTSKIFVSAECALNTALHIAEELEQVADQIRIDFKKISKEKLKIAKLVKNSLHYNLMQSFKDVIDDMRDEKYKHRMLYSLKGTSN